MAFDPNVASGDFHVLVEIALDGSTLRYADRTLALSDDTFYDGRVLQVSNLRRSAGKLLDPRLTSPRMRIVLDNADDAVRTLADANEFGNRTVTIKVGNGATATDYSSVFVGTVLFPGGVAWDDKVVSIELSDKVDKAQRNLPINKFFQSNYPFVEEKAKNLPIPLVWGDFGGTAGGGEKVPCYCINITAGTGGQFKIADHSLKEIEAVFLDGVDITANCTLDATNGEFTITSTTTYDQLTNTVTANVKGATDDGTPSGVLLQSLPDILDDLLQTHLGVDAGDIDATAFSDWEGELDATEYGRRAVCNELSSSTLIADLLVDGFADIFIKDGKYFPVYRIVDTSAVSTVFRENDIVAKSDGSKQFRIVRDADRVYANQVVGEYRYDPANSVYRGRFDDEDATEIASALTRQRRRLSMNWIYKNTGAVSRASRELFVFKSEQELAELTLSQRSLTLNPTDLFLLAYNKYISGATGTAFQVRDINTNLSKMTATLRIWNVDLLTSRAWTNDAANDWGGASANEKATNGFWTNDAGLADAGDADSNTSIWF